MSEKKKKDKVLVEDKDLKGDKVSVLVVKPTPTAYRDSQISYNKTFRSALESGALLRQKLTDYMEEQGIWDDDKQKEYDDLLGEISVKEEALNKGGIPIKEAKELAISMREKRVKFRALIAERTALDTNSVEGQSDNARFNALVCSCVLDPNTKAPIFQNLDDYDKLAEEPWSIKAASELANMIYEIDPNYDNNLVENKFLVKYNFANDDLRLINNDGHLVDIEGRLINEEGRFIDYRKDGTVYFVNIEGVEIDEGGDKVVEFSPFLDDDGKPIPVPKSKGEEEKSDEKAAKPKATRSSKKKVESS